MASLIGKLYFWTLSDNILIKDTDIGCYKLYDKGEHSGHYLSDKQEFAEGRGIVWIPRNKRPEKLRDCLKELEVIQSTQRCVTAKWDKRDAIQAVYNNGIIAILKVGSENGSIDNIILDNYLVGKLVSDHVVDIILEEKFAIVSYVEPKLTYVYFGKSRSGAADRNRKERLSQLEPKLVITDLIGPTGRRLERRLSANSLRDWILVWWHIGSEEVWPWMPVNSDKDRASMAVYSIENSNISLLCFIKLDGELIYAKFSQHRHNRIFTLEKHPSRNAQSSLNICVYDIIQSKFHRNSVTAVPIQSGIIASEWNKEETKLIISFSDKSLFVYDRLQQNSIIVASQFVITTIAWHPSGTIVIVGSEKGQLQCYDCALSSIKLQLLSDEVIPSTVLEIPAYFRYQPVLLKLLWESYGDNSNENKEQIAAHTTLCLMFDNGPLALLVFPLGVISKGQLTPRELINQYLKCNQVKEAISLLLSLDWNYYSEICYQCINKIVQHLLRRPLDRDREIQLEAAIGTFYKPSYPLSDVTILEYRDRVSLLARRFFHHLLRYRRFEKAFLLAVDLGNRDLFLDLHYMAIDEGENVLADVALEQANQLDTRCAETSSATEESEYEDSTEFSDESSIEEQYIDRTCRKSLAGGKHIATNHKRVNASDFVEPSTSSSVSNGQKISFRDVEKVTLQDNFSEQHYLHTVSYPTSIPVGSKPLPGKSESKQQYMSPLRDFKLSELVDPNEQFVDDTAPSKLPSNYLVYDQEVSDDDDIENARVKFVHFGVI